MSKKPKEPEPEDEEVDVEPEPYIPDEYEPLPDEAKEWAGQEDENYPARRFSE